ncbi:malonic semialdehyde reductase [Arthrobacter sp. zg-Y859]|uniref:Malonic semialdehyde reductase n=1 Tax=Arthrobacter jinronghuae TaxID=2964609 RepID=A0ABT1NQL4_9MICC|nr:malonic semialdehyde reductase [Arthrobacter jinronghuae]MCQ1950031.1 malonic semialdehyde reductase [Arthrobacter jinronghuae]MCQ1956803.1 malonic semialdehyde reductase [Arthrobacter jinronghuae]UWX80172.1 malonic semialdehyde reductase [Arthrobacter jinronghuae]
MNDGTLESIPAIDAAALGLLFRDARTVSEFTTAAVTDEQLQAIYDLTKMGPTAMNIQPLRITWVRSAAARQRLVQHMAEGNKAKTAAAPMVAVLSFDRTWPEHFPTVFPPAPQQGAVFAANPELSAVMGNDNAHLQAGYFLLAVRALGLAAGPMGGFDAAGLDADLHAGLNLQSFLVVNIGVPAGEPRHPRLPRLDYATATTEL